jgi:DNA-damage-inducible protein J
MNRKERGVMPVATVNYSLRVDEADKQKAEQVFKALGMTFSTGINIYIKAVGRQKKIPFDLAVSRLEANASATISHKEREQAFNALNGVLSGHTVDLDKEREERIRSK